MAILKAMPAVLAALLATAGAGAAELSGRVSYADGLYTYTYELSASDTPVIEVLVLVNSTAGRYSLVPLASTSPTGWNQATYGGFMLDGTYSQYVTWWGWGTREASGTAPVSGFSFTTAAAPAAAPVAITYALFSPEYTGGPTAYPNFFLGSIVAPDFLLPADPPSGAIPEPATYGMMLAGLALLGVVAARRQKEQNDARRDRSPL